MSQPLASPACASWELLPASRSELRCHQLQAVRWLSSLERQGAGGILADESEADRCAAVCGLLSHLASNPPAPLPLTGQPPQPGITAMTGGGGPAGGSHGVAVGPHAVLLLAPGDRLARWSSAIAEHVEVDLLLNDGSEDFMRTLRAVAADLAPAAGVGGGSAAAGRDNSVGCDSGSGTSAGSNSADRSAPFLSRCAFGGSSGSGCGPGLQDGGGAADACGQRRGICLEALPAPQALCRMPAGSRVILSAGEPEPVPGDCIWLLLQLLAPQVQQPLWQAIAEVQQRLLAPENAELKDRLLGEIHSRLWALLRPLQLSRRARDFDLANMRANSTHLNLYDHFSAARADGV
ncbi:hypothetical protein GPECTOR_11g278 [Gonium pectorale]|uniref:SNF2 N-terminal domain-containing protein n=1 Tax=Gonium pectorale TaxID=33097 RepID=A0A150GPT2_GONPE|nr:hypothetical protein GPECTOR_11g278 [Gonium pectorale]|eukprot:KXZ51839.1 hypothetical protein GPECTOR_11g278 [Gonium pectorale]